MIAATALIGCEDTGDVEGHVWTAQRGQPADGRTEHEADTEGRAEQTDQPRPFGLGCQIGDGCLGDRQAAARRAVDDAAGEQQPQHACGAGDEAADGGAHQRDDDHRLAADVVRQSPEQRRTQQLGQRERCEQEADREARRTEPLGISTEDRHDDSEPDEVERHGGPDRPVPLGHRSALSLRHDPPFHLIRYLPTPSPSPNRPVGDRFGAWTRELKKGEVDELRRRVPENVSRLEDASRGDR